MIDVVIVVDGGVVQDVYSKNKDVKITVIDFDNLKDEENPEITRGNYSVIETDCNFTDIIKDILDNYEVEAKIYEPVMQCCTCENYFEELNEDRCCPHCGSGNWVHGYIDEKGYYEDANN